MSPELAWWARKIFVWIVWIAVGVVMVPLARRKKVSALKWYFIGLGAFYGPFLTIGYGPIFLSLLVRAKPSENPFLRFVLGNLGLFLGAGFSAGVGCLYAVRARLSRLPTPGD